MRHSKLSICAIAALLAGCAGHAMHPTDNPLSARDTSNEHAALRSKLKKLTWRVSKLKRQLKSSAPSRTLVEHVVAPDLNDLRKRMSEVEQTLREGYRFGREVPSPQSPPGSSSGADERGEMTKRLAALEQRQRQDAEWFKQLSQELGKDRALVVDFLEDLDSRVGELEKRAGIDPSEPSAPTATPKP